jgi:hypothetical protein
VRIRTASLLALAAALIVAAPASATTADEAIAFLNQQRAANAIPASVALDAYRTTGCKNHNHYMALNGIGHGEDAGNPGYTTEGADYTNSGEVVAQGAVGWTAGSNPWDTAPLHQTLIFDPQVNSAGYDESEGFACMRFGFDFTSPPAPAFYAYTGDLGRTEVPPTVTVQGEGPYAPQEAVGIRQGVPTGPNILFFIQGFGSSNHAVPGSFSITGPDGPVDARMVDSSTPPPAGQTYRAFDSGGDLIPVEPLEPFADYNVAITWENDSGQQMPQTLSFKTGGFLRGLKLSLARKLSRSRKAKLTVPFEAVGQRATVRITGGKAASTKHLVLKRKQSIKVPKARKGGKVTVKVSVRTFTNATTRFTVTPAKRTYR